MQLGITNATSWLAISCATTILCILLAWLYLRLKKRAHLLTRHTLPVPDSFHDSTEVVVVGAGVLGSAIAAVLSRDGRKVTLIERDTSEPDRIVGELLQPGGYRALKKLGLEAATEGIDAHVVHGYVVHDNDSNSTVELSYPLDELKRIQTGRSYHHGRFIMGLRREAIQAGARMVEGTVTSLLEDVTKHIRGVAYKNKETGEIKTIQADLTIVADGCFSRFRKGLTQASVSVSSHFVGLVMENCPQFKHGHAEIVLGTSGPILVYQISSNETRILIDIQGKMPSDLKDYIRNNILPQLPEDMRGPLADTLNKDRVRSMPNCFLPPIAHPTPGVLLLGDAFNMRHPLTGAGMSVALNDVVMWRELLSGVPDLKHHQRILDHLKMFQWKRKGSHSFVVNVLAQALYALFSASDEYLYELRQACVEYFKLGGSAVSGPVGLLSVLKPHPLILIGHFFAVAFYAIYRIFCSYTITQLHKGGHRALMIFIKACSIIFPLISSELSYLIS